MRDGAHSVPRTKGVVREKSNKFWQTRIYSRLMSWGRDFKNVKKYILQNTLEALGILPYTPRAKGTRSKTCELALVQMIV